jgi:hypothetical protein
MKSIVHLILHCIIKKSMNYEMYYKKQTNKLENNHGPLYYQYLVDKLEVCLFMPGLQSVCLKTTLRFICSQTGLRFVASDQIWVASYFGQNLTYPYFTIFSSGFLCNILKS